MSKITAAEIDAVNRRAVNSAARKLAARSGWMNYSTADLLGEDALNWMETRLGLLVIFTARRVEWEPYPFAQ